MILTYRYRVKDAATAKYLERHARAVNFVWNYCADVQRQAVKWQRRWPTAFDLIKLCTGASAELAIHSDMVSATCRRFVASRQTSRRCPRFRTSYGPRRALGWVPLIPRAFKLEGALVRYLGRSYRLWLSRPLSGKLRDGCFSQDARGRWYFNVLAELPDRQTTGTAEIGIDLGLKNLATCSDGQTIPALQHYRQHEVALGKAQRADNKARVRTVHAKIANCRRDHLHKVSTRLVRSSRRIVVGNVSASAMAKTTMAKSVLDAGWSSFRNMLRYKAIGHGVEYLEVNEAFTTRTCSACGVISASSPKGMGALGIRSWECADCGTIHDRDVNAARNILRVGAECRPRADEIAA